MQNIYHSICNAKKNNRKLLAILLDPDKIDFLTLESLIEKINQSPATHLFVGGSVVHTDLMDGLIIILKEKCDLPVLLFPGNPSQVSYKADGILFLSLLSGRNPDYLVQYQVDVAKQISQSDLQVIPTAYLLIESGSKTAVEKVSQTQPMPVSDIEKISSTALAGQLLGMQLVYLEAGSGAKKRVPDQVISEVSQNLQIPLIVGGGIRSAKSINEVYRSGADMIVIGTAFENDFNFFNEIEL